MRKLRYYTLKFKSKLLKSLHPTLRKKLIRRSFNIDIELPDKKDIYFKIAETIEEYEQAFTLLQNAYEEQKIVSKSTTGLRITKYNLLPSTTVFIAKKGDQVIATISQIMDTAMGLPIDYVTSIEHLRQTGKRISELSALAISKDWRSYSSGLFSILCMYAYKYSIECIGTKIFVIVTDQRARYIYEDIFLFKPLTGKVQGHRMLNAPNAFAQFTDCSAYPLYLNDVYQDAPFNKNLYKILTTNPWKDRTYFPSDKSVISNPLHDREKLKRFFKNNHELLENLSDQDKSLIIVLYGFSHDRTKLIKHIPSYLEKRKYPRFYTNMKATVNFQHLENDSSLTKCLEVSRGGFCLEFSDTNQLAGLKSIQISFNDLEECFLEAEVAWKKNNMIGFKISDIPAQWHLFISQLETSKLNKIVS